MGASNDSGTPLPAAPELTHTDLDQGRARPTPWGMRVRVALVAAALAGLAGLYAIAALESSAPADQRLDNLLDPVRFLWILTPAIVAGVICGLAAPQLLHRSRRRAYLAAVVLPLAAYAALTLLVVVDMFVEAARRPVQQGTIPATQILTNAFFFTAFGLLLVGWVIPLLGLFGTWLIRRLWYRADAETGP